MRRRFNVPAVAIVAALSLVTLVVVFVLRDVLVAAPEAAFPLMLTLLVGGAFVVALLARRKRRTG